MHAFWVAFSIAVAIVIVARILPAITAWILAPHVVREAERIVEG